MDILSLNSFRKISKFLKGFVYWIGDRNFMKIVISKRHLFKFYFTIIFVTILYLGLASTLIFFYKKQIEIGYLSPKDKLMPLFSIAIYILAVYSLYSYIKNAPKITLDKKFINFNNQTFLVSDIEKIELTGKGNFKCVLNIPMEAMTLKFNNGEIKYIFDDMYSNSWEIKSYIKQLVIDKEDFFDTNKKTIDLSWLNNDNFITYKGSVITSMRGISLWGIISFFTFLLLNNHKTISVWPSLGYLCFSLFWLLLHSYIMNYFEISDNLFVVRNHNFFWSKKAYRITDIKEIVFESPVEMPNCLRVITKDFKNKLYPAGTLRDKTWLALKDKLETYKIKVRNECIFEKL
jgi:hypothetical protein